MKNHILLILSVLTLILSLNLIMAQSISIEFANKEKSFSVGEKIALRVSLLSEQGNPINDKVELILEDAKKIEKIVQTVSSNEFVEIDLEDKTKQGDWTIKANYQEITTTEKFAIEIFEKAEFSLDSDKLTIKNIGNSEYNEIVEITIGNTISEKEVKLGVGQSISFRLIAPDGNYKVRVNDGKTSFERTNVALTGRVVGILDENIGRNSPLTGGIKPDENNQGAEVNVFQNKFVYAFILVIFGAMILLAVERHYRKKANK